MSDERPVRLVNAATARLYLCMGGIGGFHRLYCGQLYEAFVYLTTFGVFLIGPLFDVFHLPALVQWHNDRQITKPDDDDEVETSQQTTTSNIRYSLRRFFFQVAYASWMGLLGVFLSIFPFKDTSDRLGLTLLVSFAIASGVWISGCCGSQKCNFLNAWLASISASIFTIYLSDTHTIRSLVMIAVASALNANRTLRHKKGNEDAASIKNYAFWASLFFTSVSIIWIGLSRTVLHREIGFVLKNSTIRVKSIDVGTFFREQVLENKPTLLEYSLTEHSLEYIPILPRGHGNVPWKKKASSKKPPNLPHIQLVNLFRNLNYEFEFHDDSEKIAEYHWTRYMSAFLADYSRISLLNKQLAGKTSVQPFVFTLWRMYLIVSFNSDPFASDEELLRVCKPFVRKSEMSIRHSEESEQAIDWSMASKVRACQILRDAAAFM